MKLLTILLLLFFCGMYPLVPARAEIFPGEEERGESIFRISRIVFHNNNLLSDSELTGVINTRINSYLDQQIAIEDSRRISEIYGERGFGRVKVFYPEVIPVSPDEVEVHFHIDEGELYNIKQIVLSGNSYISAARIYQLTRFSETGNYTNDQLNLFLVRLVDIYTARGFLFAQAELESLTAGDEGMIAHIRIDEGSFCRFEEFVFEGNNVTKEKTLMRISGLDRMQLFSPEKLLLAEENVRRKEYISDFSIIPVNYQTLLLRVTEDRMTHIYGMLGYDSSQQNSSDRFTGFINLKLLNLYGTDRSLALFWRKLHRDRQSVEFRYTEPGLNNYPVAGELRLFRETVDSTHILTTIDSEVYYYTLRNKYGIYIGSDEIFPGIRRPKLVEKRTYRKIGLFWHYNSEDYYLNPTQGMSFKAKHYYIFHREMGEWVNKQATELNWNHYLLLSKQTTAFRPVVLMISLNGKQIENKSLQDYEYYSLGGIHNLRGFRERQFTGGYRIAWTNTELRYLLTRKSRVFIFLDYGYMQEQERVLNDLIGVGFGVRLDTRIGLIGVDYGFSQSQGEWMHPLDGMVHFGVETKF